MALEESNLQSFNHEENESVLRDVLNAIKGLEQNESPDYSFLQDYSDEVVAQVIESVPATIRSYIWLTLTPDRYWPILLSLQFETVRHLVDSLDVDAQLRLGESASAQDLIELADVLPDEMVDAIILGQDSNVMQELQEALAYDDEVIGRYVNKNILKVRPGFSVGNIVKKIKAQSDIVAIFAEDREGGYLGYIPLKSLFVSDPEVKAKDITLPLAGFDHEELLTDAAMGNFSNDTIDWYPVFRDGKLLGSVSVWTLLEQLQENAVDTGANETPGGEEDLFTPVAQAAKIRGLWLVVNLCTAFLAAWVIGLFEATLQEVIALAILMPVVASMGGIAGSQTLAVAMRGLTLNSLNDANIKLVLQKEAKIAIINGLILGLFIAVVVFLWFDSYKLASIILIAISVNSLAAASSGTLVPFILKKMKIDPAVSAAVILTTVTDVVGFFVFLALASLVF